MFNDPPLWLIAPVYICLSIVLYQDWLLFSVGIIIWQVSEYIAHRWVLHGPYKSYHRVHHIDPRRHISLPLGVSTIGAMVYVVLLPLGAVAGVFAGYVAYEITHQMNPSWHKRHHINPKRYFGVTIPI